MTALLLFLACVPVGNAAAQTWDTFRADVFNLRFDLPVGWTTEVKADDDVPALIASSPDGEVALVVLVYRDAADATTELLDAAIEQLEVELDGEALQEELNGLQAWVAEAVGEVEGVPAGFYVLAASYGSNAYVAYLFTPLDRFDEQAEMMNVIIDSFAPVVP